MAIAGRAIVVKPAKSGERPSSRRLYEGSVDSQRCPYGIERTYNGLRIAGALAKHQDAELKIFLMGDSVIAAVNGQKVPAGYYNAQVMLTSPTKRGAAVGVCGTCMDARGVQEAQLTAGAHRSSMDELTDWIVWADKVISY